MADVPTTQRAYTLRLCGETKDDQSWRDTLWRTHVAVNRGAKAFGEWLLTLRGGICHTHADEPIRTGKSKPDRPPNDAERRHRRIVLALSWLSVESHEHDGDAPHPYFVSVVDGKPQTVAALRQILATRGVPKTEITDWILDCEASLQAAIREGGVWVNRSLAFDDSVGRLGPSLTRDEIWDVFERFFGSREAYFGISAVSTNEDDEERDAIEGTAMEKAKDLVIKAGGWLSNRFGTKDGADFASIAEEYERFAKWCRNDPLTSSPDASLMARSLADAMEQTTLDSRLAGTPGPSNKVQTSYEQLVASLQKNSIPDSFDFAQISIWAEEQSIEKRQKVGNKGHREWCNRLLHDVESRCGFTYIDPETRTARHWEFSVILDHAARRLCQMHSWIKLAEGRRREFELDARKLDRLKEEHPQVVAWLDNVRRERSDETGALDNDGYRIRKRAITDWDDVVKQWRKPACVSFEDRVQAAREIQADPENEKPGDIYLYETLATDDAKVVWLINGKPDAQLLKDYVAAMQAEFDKRRFKVPAYRHPDELRHPVFCDFGNSRWDICFAVHRAVAQRASQVEKVHRQVLEVEKASKSLSKAKTEEKKSAAQLKLDDAKGKLKIAQENLHWLESPHGIEMTLWNGSALGTVRLNWQSKRLSADFVLENRTVKGAADTVAVTRANRLGRAAADAKSNSRLSLLGLLESDEWNGRLQAPRAELDAIAAVRDGEKCRALSAEERRLRVNTMISKLHWLVSFSARLQPQGPWFEFTNKLPQGVNYSIKRGRLYYDVNKERKWRSQLTLSRLPGLRVLSVDLGHRFAAACAVWQAISTAEIRSECTQAGAKIPKRESLHWSLHKGPNGKQIYRRIADDFLPDGSPHPAPWARLERQFLIKLQGEDEQARAATDQERASVKKLEDDIGYVRSEIRKGADWRVDELMSDVVRTVRNAIRRHADYARIARDLVASSQTLPGGRRSVELHGTDLVNHLLDVLVRWHDLATATRWIDPDGFGRRSWQNAGLPQLDSLPQIDEDLIGPARKKRRTEIELALKPAAEKLAKRDRMRLHIEWQQQWEKHDKLWQSRLRWLNRWIAPRGKKHGRSIRRAGGSSLKRISTFTSLYQVQKAFYTRLRPITTSDEKPVTAGAGFGQRILNSRNRMRETRVKQLASRIAEAALGIGKAPGRNQFGKQITRPRERVADPRFAHCHAVVIENLARYRPDELQTRRENRQLMTWQSAQVKKYVSDHCELYGLHLCEVSPAYTSRQDSRTGSPGVRCVDLTVTNFAKRFSRKLAVITTEKKNDALSVYLVAIKEKYLDNAGQPKPEYKDIVVRIPYRGGEIFVSSDQNSSANGLQADLNAAANIGLKGLLDPDWPGAWWYIPAVPHVDGKFIPKKESTSGSHALDGKLLTLEQQPSTISSGKSKDVVNLWRDVSNESVDQSLWFLYSHYQNVIMKQVVERLLKKR